ncbi:MAG: hypothetical protein ISR78_08260 [Spirochaetia bacterium]|nr:hypothetical protein [Spirochaetia bacterium]
MERNGLISKILVIVGNILLWIPILMPCIFLIFALVQRGQFLFDFLMPAELFPATIAGALLLFWVAVRIKKRRAFLGWGTGFAVLMLLGSQLGAAVSGLASGETEPGGAAWFIVLGMMILYDLALVFVGIHGILLLKDLVRDSRKNQVHED